MAVGSSHEFQRGLISPVGGYVTSKAYFDDVATQWDQMRQSFFPEATRDRAFAVAHVQAGQLAADIGAGTGFVSIFVASGKK